MRAALHLLKPGLATLGTEQPVFNPISSGQRLLAPQALVLYMAVIEVLYFAVLPCLKHHQLSV